MAEKTKSSFINMVLTLFVVTGVAALSLGAVYSVTKAPIAEAQKKKLDKAIAEVIPAFEDKKIKTFAPADGSKDSLIFYYGYDKDGKLVGTAVKTYTDKGFSGRFTIMVGFAADGKIHNTALLSHKETPGLGTKMAEEKFKSQFRNLDLEKSMKADAQGTKVLLVSKDDNSSPINAITAATISSRGFCDAVTRAYNTFIKEGGKK